MQTLQQAFDIVKTEGRNILPESLALLQRANALRQKYGVDPLAKIDPASVTYQPTHATVDRIRVPLPVDASLIQTYLPGTLPYESIAAQFAEKPRGIKEGKIAQTYVVGAAFPHYSLMFESPTADFTMAEVVVPLPPPEDAHTFLSHNGDLLKMRRLFYTEMAGLRLEAESVSPETFTGVALSSDALKERLDKIHAGLPVYVANAVRLTVDFEKNVAHVSYNVRDGRRSAEFPIDETVAAMHDFVLWNRTPSFYQGKNT